MASSSGSGLTFKLLSRVNSQSLPQSQSSANASNGGDDPSPVATSPPPSDCKSLKIIGNWSEIPQGVLEIIAKRIGNRKDFARFGAVCKSWQAAAEKENFKGLALREHIPYLMLAGEEEEREFYSLQQHEIVAKVTLPCLQDKKCIESLGWLLIVGIEGDMSLLEPLTGVEIELPHYTTFLDVKPDSLISGNSFVSVKKMVLTSRPDKSSDFVVMVIGGKNTLGFWSPGDHQWNSIRSCGHFHDVTYFNGKFYAIDVSGFVVVYDFAGPNPTNGSFLTHPTNEGPEFKEIAVRDMDLYIVEFFGDLVVIARNTRPQRILNDACKFRIFRVDTSSGRWEKIYSLATKAAFIGHSATTLVETSKFHELKANHIYYTMDCGYLIDRVAMDDLRGSYEEFGVYNLETNDNKPFYQVDEGKLFSQITPAVWFTPSFM